MSDTTYPKYKVIPWGDTTAARRFYGIDRQEAPYATWRHCCLGKEPMFYSTEAEAKAVIRDLRNKAKAKTTAPMKLHADIRALKRAGPKDARFLIIQSDGNGFWLTESRSGVVGLIRISDGFARGQLTWISMFNGCVVFCDIGGAVFVDQAQWVAARKRKRDRLAAREAK